MDRRMLGKTQEELSIIGLNLEKLLVSEDAYEVKRYLEKFILRGVNFFEISLKFEPKDEAAVFPINLYRDQLFIAGRSYSKSGDEIQQDIKELLAKFNLQYLDLIQIIVKTQEDIHRILGPEGALEGVFAAKNLGLIKYIGFSTNKESIALKLLESYDFDSITFPIDWMNWYTGFGRKVISKAKEKGTGVISKQNLIKKITKVNEEKGISDLLYIPSESYEEVKTTIRFSLTKPITSILCSSHIDLLEWLIQAADEFTPLDIQEEENLRKSCEDLAKVFNPKNI
ncbi:MAG: Aldo/keto reductase [Petrotoga mobilis]|nr:MAG: Aldo/keto reductase [Petrotoga mobilis]